MDVPDMLINQIAPIHPGEILAAELRELGLSARTFARALGVPHNRVTAILRGQRAITADTALRLGQYFGTTAKFWLNLQQSHDLKVVERERGRRIRATVKRRAAGAW
jgi:addiction module HigA family antidote